MTDKIADNQIENRQIVYLTPLSTIDAGDEVDLLGLWQAVWRWKFLIVGISLLATVAAGYVVFFVLPVTYQSQTVLLPNSSDASSSLGGLASLASTLPIPISVPGGTGSSLVLFFLKSRDFKQKLIEKYDLLPRLYKHNWHNWEVTKRLLPPRSPADLPTAIYAIQKGKMDDVYQVAQDTTTQLITINWVDEDPAFAAEMLKQVLVELDHFLAKEYVSDAKRERLFVEKQLADATRELEKWEKQVPTAEITLDKIKREQLATSTVYAELRKQVELAKFTEEKEVVSYKTIDQTFVPQDYHRPKRGLICVLVLLFTGFVSISAILVRKAVGNTKQKKKVIKQR